VYVGPDSGPCVTLEETASGLMSPESPYGGTSPEIPPVGIVARTDLVLALVTIALGVGVAAVKVWLAWRLNLNWDEFYFLNHVYALTRGELTLLLQGSYTHAFTWLTYLPGHEADQVVAGRLVMVALLALTAWLVWRLARVWMHGLASVLPPFVFLTTMPVLEHGGSFRADSILAPLTVAALLLLLSPGRRSQGDWLAGAMLGVAFAVTVKVVLFAPLVFFAILYRGRSVTSSPRLDSASAGLAMARVGAAAAMVAAALIGLHALSVQPEESQSITNFAASSAGTTLLETPWFPRLDYFLRYFDWQPLPWILIAVGTGAALVRRRFDVAALSLSLLPLVFYRNAFPYYFVVMLAPASILVGWAVAEISAATRRYASEWTTASLIAVLWLGTVFNGVRYLDRFVFDDQWPQRQIIAGVHQIFPEPVSYIDRCGMVSSFRKANFFMSTWGLDAYRDRSTPVMRSTLATQEPAFVLVNVPALSPSYEGQLGLLPEDQALLARHYVDYWGPVRVAGADVTLAATALRVTVPFAGKYRLATTEPLLIDDDVRMNGDIIDVPAEGVEMARIAGASAEAATVRLVIASAKPPPDYEPAGFPLFRNL
jgi:hypothetical protein